MKGIHRIVADQLPVTESGFFSPSVPRFAELPVHLPKVAPVALRLAIGKYVSQRETSYLNPKVAPVALRLAIGTCVSRRETSYLVKKGSGSSGARSCSEVSAIRKERVH
jgi:hypothetical protein